MVATLPRPAPIAMLFLALPALGDTTDEFLRLQPNDGASGDVFGATAGAADLFDITAGQELPKLLPSDGVAEDDFGSDLTMDSHRWLDLPTRRDHPFPYETTTRSK